MAYGGSYSLHLVASGAGSASSQAQAAVPVLPSASPCTLSFWFLPSTNGSGVNFRVTTSYRSLSPISYRPVQSTPGAANSVLSTIPAFPALWLNEVLPVNLTGITNVRSERQPWIEIYNAGASAISLDGYYLANNYSNINQWPFPAGSSIGPGEFKVIFADNEAGTASEWHANFRPGSANGSIALAWTPSGSPQVLDYLNYTNLTPTWSYGAYPDGQPFDRQALYRPTPGGTNNNIAPPLTVSINEWMASNTKTLLNTNGNNRYDDWFELYNPTASPADLAGYYLTDNLLNPNQFHIPAGYVIPPHGFLLVWADNQSSRNSTNDPALHVNFRLANEGEQIGLFASDGSLIDGVTFEPQFSDISEGRYPDGASSIYFLATATPRAPNTSWANRYPVLNPIADAVAIIGEPFTFTATASDPDGNALAFSLDLDAPVDASIGTSSGVFSWTPASLSTNIITVRVADNGMPALSAARTFTIFARPGIRIGRVQMSAPGQLSVSFSAAVGKHYHVEFKNSLSEPSWTPILPDSTANSSTLVITINIGPEPQRFYRLVQVD